jgi:hypothetical protein
MGMDAILALQGVLLVNGNEQINPLFGTSNEAKINKVVNRGFTSVCLLNGDWP